MGLQQKAISCSESIKIAEPGLIGGMHKGYGLQSTPGRESGLNCGACKKTISCISYTHTPCAVQSNSQMGDVDIPGYVRGLRQQQQHQQRQLTTTTSTTTANRERRRQQQQQRQHQHRHQAPTTTPTPTPNNTTTTTTQTPTTAK